MAQLNFGARVNSRYCQEGEKNLTMKNLKIIKTKSILIGSFVVSWGLINLGTQPVAAQDIPPEENSSKQANLASSAIGKNISTRAIDLLLFNSDKSSADNLLTIEQLAQRELDLKTFCQNYPYNSQCEPVRPSNEPGSIERSPVPVPVPPPANSSQNSSSRQKSGWAIVPEASTLGFGGHIVGKITPNFNARVGVNAFGLGIDIEETDLDFEGDLNLFNVSSIIDIHPFKRSGFRISGGLIFGDNNFNGTADISEEVADGLGEVEVEGQSINVRDLNINELATLDADIEINNSVAPYIGIGGGNAVGESKGLGFWWNLGVVLGGSPEVELDSNVSEETPEEIREEVEEAADDILEEEEEELEDELDFINIYPVVSLGFSYQF